MTEKITATGGCLCGAVRFEVSGPLRDVVYCHCEQCRRTSGHFVAASDVRVGDLAIRESTTLEWYSSSETARRGFCRVCGSSLFWVPVDGTRVSIMAGALDSPTGLVAREHIFVESAGDYYRIADGLPCHDRWNPEA